MMIRLLAWCLLTWFPLAIAAAETPEEIVVRVTDRVLNDIRGHEEELRRHPERLYSLIQSSVVPVVDVETFAKLVLKHHWRKATPEQRRRFIAAFKRRVVRTYGTYLIDYADTRVRLLPTRPASNPTRRVVRTRIEVPGKQPMHVDYYFHKKGGKWLVYDVVVDGTSLVLLFRDDIGQKVASKGLDAVIQELEHAEAGS
jgi:phospholipid transport system substrate-binding protein